MKNKTACSLTTVHLHVNKPHRRRVKDARIELLDYSYLQRRFNLAYRKLLVNSVQIPIDKTPENVFYE